MKWDICKQIKDDWKCSAVSGGGEAEGRGKCGQGGEQSDGVATAAGTATAAPAGAWSAHQGEHPPGSQARVPAAGDSNGAEGHRDPGA